MEVATCVMVGAVSDLLARLSLAVVTFFFVVDSRLIFFVGTCITVFLRIGKYLLIYFLIFSHSAIIRGSTLWTADDQLLIGV